MYCPKCGTQNAEHARTCAACGQALAGPGGSGMPVKVKISGLAIASFVLGILSVLGGLTAIPAIILGIIALIVIEKSGGRLTGLAFAIIGIVIPVFAVILMMGIMLPALARVRQLAFRMTCGTNLSVIGKAMLLYANDYEDELPRPGGRGSTWGPVADWVAPNRYAAYGMANDGSGGEATISSSFYLLVKYAEVTPKSFVCKGDTGTTEWWMADETNVDPSMEMIDAWEFGDTGAPPRDSLSPRANVARSPRASWLTRTRRGSSASQRRTLRRPSTGGWPGWPRRVPRCGPSRST